MTSTEKRLEIGVTVEILEELYDKYNNREYLHPDPLEVVYRYCDPGDREIVGLVAASLAYGNVKQIIRSVDNALGRMGESPYAFLSELSENEIPVYFDGFRHRFTTGDELARLLVGVKNAIRKYGSLRDLFAASISIDDNSIVPAITSWTAELTAGFEEGCSYLLPSPSRGSACKRINLFLKWMVRRDEIDPGVWSGISPALLIIPLDTHMHRICAAIGLTSRKQANLKTALEITDKFRLLAPDDPTKYDFAITRLGIRDDASPDEFIAACR